MALPGRRILKKDMACAFLSADQELAWSSSDSGCLLTCLLRSVRNCSIPLTASAGIDMRLQIGRASPTKPGCYDN
ncbi:MAG: hypothetical protein JWQ23_2774 [Herminiimonas sp.]|nr:hypothetical protein [Herminiimonas sp.]